MTNAMKLINTRLPFKVVLAFWMLAFENAVGRQLLPLQRNEQHVLLSKLEGQDNICFNHIAGEFVPHAENCRLFYLCNENGEVILAACPTTMLFNPQTNLCDSPSNVDCPNELNLNTQSPAPSLSPGTITPSDPMNENDEFANEIREATRYCASLATRQEIDRITYIGSSIDCRHYFMCYHGQAILQECSTNLHWNAPVGKCDMPSKAGCEIQLEHIDNNNDNSNNNNNGHNVDDSNNDDSSAWSPDTSINCPSYGQHVFPHMERCDLFIYCIKGHATLQMCPFYYQFDVVTKSCKRYNSALCARDINFNFQN